MLTLNEIQTHLRLPLTSQDDEIDRLHSAALDYVSQYLGRDIPWSTDTESQVYPESVKQAVLLVIGDFYENREAAFVGVPRTDNPTVERLLHFYRSGLGV